MILVVDFIGVVRPSAFVRVNIRLRVDRNLAQTESYYKNLVKMTIQ